MTKQANDKTEQVDNLPALPIDPVIEKELEDSEGVLELDDFTIKMKPREKVFQVSYDASWTDVNEIPPVILFSSEVYWAQFDGKEYRKRPLDDPPPESDIENWAKYGKLSVFHTKYGRGGFLLSPTGVLAFKAYFQKWKRLGIEIFGKPVKIYSRVTKTQKGFVLNIPQFLPGWNYVAQDLPEPANSDPPELEHKDSDHVVELDDDIPF